ncbi:hypothetical protein CRG98_003657 [Punica granatum]|uniref:Uncharacterized protein n=1 Tax=Punica granatum TaxID=22663 RepID=A0A2I0L5H7_PUNGR|nr:hypothetical protein CRG98_003657 [Punica granatum]
MRCKKIRSNRLADPARLQVDRGRWLGELAVHESKLARVSRPRKDAGGTSEVARRTCDRARLHEARARWLGELAVQESKLAWVSIPSKVASGRNEVARRTYGSRKYTRTGKRTRQGCKRHEGGGSSNLRRRKVSSHGLADPTRLQEARARWLGELAVQESKLAWVSIPSKVASGRNEVARRTYGSRKYTRTGKRTRQGCKRHERGGSANLQCRKVNSHELADLASLHGARARWLGEIAVVNSHGLADPARLQEARARWLGELAVQESKLAQVSRPGKVARGTSEVARRTCGARKPPRTD